MKSLFVLLCFTIYSSHCQMAERIARLNNQNIDIMSKLQSPQDVGRIFLKLILLKLTAKKFEQIIFS